MTTTPTKIGVNQHDILHKHYPNDCCLCKAEARIRALERQLEDTQDWRKCRCEMPFWKPDDIIHCAKCGKLLPDILACSQEGCMNQAKARVDNQLNAGNWCDVHWEALVTKCREKSW